MAKTLLQGVNAVLKKATVLDSQGELSSITDSSRQMFIDVAIQSINEVVDEVYSALAWSKPRQLKEATITLTSAKAYSLRSDMVMLRDEYDLIDETNNHEIILLGESGYWQIIKGDLEQDDTGQPNWAAIRPTDGKLFLDREPAGTAIGRVYKYRYDRDIEFDDADDEMPFSDLAFRRMIPAAAELYKFHTKSEFSQKAFDAGVARCAAAVRQQPRRSSYRPSKSTPNITDPMSHA